MTKIVAKIFLSVLLFTVFLTIEGCENSTRLLEITEADVVETLPHKHVFTEGLFFNEGVLYESAGRIGESEILRYGDDYRKAFDDMFLEGSVIYDNDFYLLTWQDHIAYVLDTGTFEIKKECTYDREGWGLTTDGDYLIASDGTDCIYYMDSDYNVVRILKVQEEGKPVTEINELEYIEGHIFGNIWHTNDIVCIDPKTGEVEARYAVKLESKSADQNVLNGIAWDGEYVYLTGKYYDEIWKVEPGKFLSAPK